MAWRTWRQAMADALYGDGGFYVGTDVPARHFRTAAHTGQVWATAMAELGRRVDSALGEPDAFTFVDVGAGGGELLTRLAELAPPRWSLLGIDVARRPPALPARVGWQRQFPDEVHGVVLAVELLDVVPLDSVELTADGMRVVEVDDEGLERIGAKAEPADRDWIARWWPLRALGERAEVGHPREAMWREITDRISSGLALAVDYAANPAEHLAGTLTGYRNGHPRTPVPDGSMDLTSHVLFESLLSAGDTLLAQREALRRLGVVATPPDYRNDPEVYLTELTRASEAAELMNPYTFGGFTWLLHPVGIPQLFR
ncbi:MAG TPA: SAM-dependent methyltransferase [Mycobacteriales bacterium]|nr:SAM-dependent methyltransferase [Mycobacteriales bacterium]